MKKHWKHIWTVTQKAALVLLVFCLTATLMPDDVTAKAALPAHLMLNVNETRNVATESGGTNYIWSSSDRSVLDVKGNGVNATLYALKPGTATVTATCTRQKPDLAWNPITETYEHTYVPYQTTDTSVVLVVDPDAPTPSIETNPAKGSVGENVAGTLEDIGGFGCGLVPVKRDGLWGYANGKLQLAIPFQYDYATSFSEGGIAYVRIGESKCIIDKKCNIVYRDSGIGYQALIYVNHTYFRVQRYYKKDSFTWENYDLNGNPINGARSSQDNQLCAALGDLIYWGTDSDSMYYNDGGENWLFGLPTDTSYKNPVLKMPFITGVEHPSMYGDGSHPVIQEGVLVARATTGKWGAVDKDGNLVIPFEYDRLYDSRDGFLAYKKGSEYGLLENSVTPPKTVVDIVPEKPENPVAPPEKESGSPVTPPKTVTDTVPEKTDTTQQEVAAVTLVKVQSKSAGKATVTWNSVACDGYQIAFSRNKSFPITKTKLVGTNSSNSAVKTMTVGGLSTGKTYYVRVRAYQTVNGKMCYSVWSAAKKVKIKKSIKK